MLHNWIYSNVLKPIYEKEIVALSKLSTPAFNIKYTGGLEQKLRFQSAVK